MPETPETGKTRAEEAAASFQMFADFLLRLADRVTRLEQRVLELEEHALAEDQEGNTT
jgi:hypothetical protein